MFLMEQGKHRCFIEVWVRKYFSNMYFVCTVSEGVDMAGTTPEGAWFDGKQPVSKMTTRLTQFYEEFNTYNEIYDSFVEMGLQENLLKGIYAYGLEKPSLVHQRGIVPLCKGLDVIQQSLSGTTVTLACGVLQRLDYGS
uniref:DEAD-box RNA helicase Q domain-containing protein n=1 Tax=Aegilops tauschii subsp. strangulata TaxID=200361 RepID=A0A453NSM0_AEGTS